MAEYCYPRNTGKQKLEITISIKIEKKELFQLSLRLHQASKNKHFELLKMMFPYIEATLLTKEDFFQDKHAVN